MGLVTFMQALTAPLEGVNLKVWTSAASMCKPTQNSVIFPIAYPAPEQFHCLALL